MLTIGSLFSGIGGFELGLERAGMRTIWQSEIDPYACAVLRKHWPDVPNIGDIRSIRAGVERPDVICGGFPCQPFSHAGKRAGTTDDRHLWPEMCRVVDELRPAYVVGENVAGIISMELDAVLSDLEALGYATRALVIPAVAVDAPHRRDRVWIIARDSRRLDADRNGRHGESDDAIRAGRATAGAVRDRDRDREPTCAVDAEAQGMPRDMADADEQGPQRRIGAVMRERSGERAAGTRGTSMGNAARIQLNGDRDARAGRRGEPTDAGRWLTEPNVGRVANGIPHRAHRLRVLGNSIVPQVSEVIGRAIIEAERMTTHHQDEGREE